MLSDYFKKNIDSLLASAVGFIIIILFTRYGGIGISPDSIAYTSAARNFISGNGFTEFSGAPLVAFPLFYPFFLGLVMFVTQHDIILVAPFLNALMFAILIFLSGTIIEHFKYKTKWYKRILLVIISISPSLIEIYSMLWSETLFIILILVFFLLFHRYLLKHNTLSLVLAATVAAIAFDTRYAGITLVGSGVLLIFFDKNLKWIKKIAHILLFGSIGVSLVILNLIRNIFENGLATGMRQESITTLSQNIGYYSSVLSDWLRLPILDKFFIQVFAVIIMLLFLLFFIRNINHWKSYYTYENIAVSFFIVYVLFIVLSSTFSRYETINNRLLAPAFLPLLWISTCQIPKWKNQMPHRRLKWVFLAFFLGIATVLIGSYFAINQDNLSYMNETGIPGYNEDTWKKSQLVNYLQTHKELFEDDSIIYSNHCQAVYFLTGHSVITLPERVYKNDVDEFKRTENSLLIWFNLDYNPDLLNLKEIRNYKRMKRIKSFSDGAIFILKN
jgi:hypothetical protein